MGFRAALLLLLLATASPFARAQTPMDEQAFLDENYPFIDPTGPPPGGWVKGDSNAKIQIVDRGRYWHGKLGWRTRHGEAVVLWDLGDPRKVFQARFPDNTRGEVGYTLDHGHRRPATRPLRWMYGTIDIQAGDVVFIDGPQPVYTPPPVTGAPNLEAEIARDPVFREALRDDRFAQATYQLIHDRTVYKGDDERGWGEGSRSVAAMIAALRGVGESYHDYHLSDLDDRRLEGVYPDHRPAREAELRAEMEQLRKPFVIDYPAPPFIYEERRIETDDQVEELRARDRKLWLDGAAQTAARQSALEQQIKDLAKNADVWDRLHAHLTRLGWRIENDRDRARERERVQIAGAAEIKPVIAARRVVLAEIEGLESRRRAPTPDWAMALKAEFEPGARIPVYAQSIHVQNQKLSDDERFIMGTDLGWRVRRLAVEGRVDRAEFEGLMQRVQRAR